MWWIYFSNLSLGSNVNLHNSYPNEWIISLTIRLREWGILLLKTELFLLLKLIAKRIENREVKNLFYFVFYFILFNSWKKWRFICETEFSSKKSKKKSLLFLDPNKNFPFSSSKRIRLYISGGDIPRNCDSVSEV